MAPKGMMSKKMGGSNMMGCNSMMMDMEELECPNHPDLILLRDAAADEREAIAMYFQAARQTCMTDLFLDIAEDEMQHYVMVMHHISMLDPVQAEKLKEEGLDELTMSGMMKKKRAKWMKKPVTPEPEDIAVSPLDAEEMEEVCYLTKALASEFHAINKYQCYMEKSENVHNQHLFCHLMNEEKEHVAELTKAMFDITQEPLPKESD
ncbi:ferritin-like domain-containing protein [Sporomusa sp.]|uniref:ferritin-like domain-containing protein n=1 Tax=Sporomusa sp. TaxID=2078658 RepID=UPI002C93E4BA|nr:ferritin-like domain-containing protein [Sporomusa sp.]HWR43475.1 ferritin-like domain-containing protein [Sporomusa sp.]